MHHNTEILVLWQRCLRVEWMSACGAQIRRHPCTSLQPMGSFKLFASSSNVERILAAATTMAGYLCTQPREMGISTPCESSSNLVGASMYGMGNARHR